MRKIGKLAVTAAMAEGSETAALEEAAGESYRVTRGRVGSMEPEKVIAAVETASKRTGIIGSSYREEHALYHAAVEALQGVCRGQLELGSVLRTVGLNFAILRGPRDEESLDDGLWVAVALYGTIGAPVKGFEHETIGLGINHL